MRRRASFIQVIGAAYHPASIDWLIVRMKIVNRVISIHKVAQIFCVRNELGILPEIDDKITSWLVWRIEWQLIWCDGMSKRQVSDRVHAYQSIPARCQ